MNHFTPRLAISPLEDRQVAACAGKVAYATQLQAKVAVKHLTRRRRKHRHSAAEPYRCKFCNEWHIGRKP